MTVWKRDIRGRGVKNETKACVLKKRKVLPSTEAGKTLGGAGRFFGGVEGARETGGGTRSRLAKWKRPGERCQYTFEARERDLSWKSMTLLGGSWYLKLRE